MTLANFSADIETLVESTAAAVFAVHARPRFHSSAVHWSPGLLVTADHALHADEDLTVSQGAHKYAAELVGRDPATDLAVLRLKDAPAGLAAITKSAAAPKPGSLAFVVGRNTESANADWGLVASTGPARHTRRGGKLDSVIRLGFSVHPVSAGAAVVDAAGHAIGIATPALSSVAVFAVPSATVDRVVQTLVEHGRARHGYLGAGLQPIPIPAHLRDSLEIANTMGLMTVSVDPDSPAGKAGLLIGDVLLALNGTPVARPEALRPLLAEWIGKSVQLQLMRGGEAATLDAVITERS